MLTLFITYSKKYILVEIQSKQFFFSLKEDRFLFQLTTFRPKTQMPSLHKFTQSLEGISKKIELLTN